MKNGVPSVFSMMSRLSAEIPTPWPSPGQGEGIRAKQCGKHLPSALAGQRVKP